MSEQRSTLHQACIEVEKFMRTIDENKCIVATTKAGVEGSLAEVIGITTRTDLYSTLIALKAIQNK